MKVIAIFAAAVLLSGCKIERSPEERQRRMPAQLSVTSSERFKVERVQVIRDPLAYNGDRGIYLLTDTHTGQEFVGVSGVGISELGMHLSGKVNIQDER